MRDWLLIAVVFATLVVFWQMLNFVFGLIEHWQAARRREEASPPKGKVF